jgi:hypothetical protein
MYQSFDLTEHTCIVKKWNQNGHPPRTLIHPQSASLRGLVVGPKANLLHIDPHSCQIKQSSSWVHLNNNRTLVSNRMAHWVWHTSVHEHFKLNLGMFSVWNNSVQPIGFECSVWWKMRNLMNNLDWYEHLVLAIHSWDSNIKLSTLVLCTVIKRGTTLYL